MNFYLDFDRTLFDTDRFYLDLEKIIDKYISIEIFNEYKNNDCIEGFNTNVILHEISKDYEINSNIYNEINEFMQSSYQYIYDDVIPFLAKYRQKYHFIILTKGNEEFQMQKIKYSHIMDYIEDIIVTLKDKGDLNLDYQNSLFVDDSKIELLSINKNNPKKLFCINRKEKDNNEFLTIKSFDEIDNLL